MPPKRIRLSNEEDEYASNTSNARNSEPTGDLQANADPAVPESGENIRVPEAVPIVNPQISEHEPIVSPQIPESDLIANPQIHVPVEDSRRLEPSVSRQVHESEHIANPREPVPIVQNLLLNLLLTPRVRDPVEDPRVPEPIAENPQVLDSAEDHQVPDPFEDPDLHERGNASFQSESSESSESVLESVVNLQRLEFPQDPSFYASIGLQLLNINWFPPEIPYDRLVDAYERIEAYQNFVGEIHYEANRFHPAYTSLNRHIRFVQDELRRNPFVSGNGYQEEIVRLFRSYPFEYSALFLQTQGAEDAEQEMMLPNQHADIPQDIDIAEERPATANLSLNSSIQVVYTYPKMGERIRFYVLSMTTRQNYFVFLNKEMCESFERVEYLTNELVYGTINSEFQSYVESLPPPDYFDMVKRGDGRVGLARRLMDDLRNINRDCHFILLTNRCVLAYVHSFTEWIREMYAKYIFTGRDIEADHDYVIMYQRFSDYLGKALNNIRRFPNFAIAFRTIRMELMKIFRTTDQGPVMNRRVRDFAGDARVPDIARDARGSDIAGDARVPDIVENAAMPGPVENAPIPGPVEVEDA